MKFKTCVALLAVLVLATQFLAAENANVKPDAKHLAAARAYAKLPLSFEPADQPGQYLARNGVYTVSIGARNSFISVRESKNSFRALHFGFENSNAAASTQPVEPLPGVVNYYRGKDAANWRLGVKTFAKVRANAVYPGIDVLYYGDNRQLEFDFVVAPNANPGAIAVKFDGADNLALSNGDIVATVGQRQVKFTKPVAYQRIDGKQSAVKAEYALNNGTATLVLGAYDKNRELIIDPVLTYASFLGGSQSDTANGIDVDTAGNAYVTGETCSPNFIVPNPNPSGTTFRGVQGACNAYVAKLDPTGSTLIYTTFIGGVAPNPPNATASANGISVDKAGYAYIVGTTNFWDLPLTSPNPSDRSSAYNGGDSDAFIAILDSDGEIIRATYLGGTNVDQGYAIAVDSQKNVTAVGQTCSDDFPAYNSIQAKVEACVAFITKLDYGLHISPSFPNASPVSAPYPSLADSCGEGSNCPATPDAAQTYYFFSTIFGGQLLPPIASVSSGYIAGMPVTYGAITIATPNCGTGSGDKPQVLMALSSGVTSKLTWPCGSVKLTAVIPDGTFNWVDLGDAPASVPYATTEAYGVALDPVGDVFAVGGSNTASLTPYLNYAGYQGIHYGSTGAWILKLGRLRGNYIYATALGTAKTADPNQSVNAARAVAVDTFANAYVVGTTTGGILVQGGGYKTAPGGKQDAFIMKLDKAASAFVYGTYFGGSGDEQGLSIAIDTGGSAYITGSTTSTDLPITNPLTDSSNNEETALLGPQDAFLARFTPTGSGLIMSAYLGGAGSDQANSIALDKGGNGDIYIAGTTQSVDFPVSTGAADTVYGGGTTDGFVALINGASFPNATVSPSVLTFGTQAVGTTSTAQTVTLQNVGAGMLTITGIQVTGSSDFAASNNCGSQLSPAGGTKDKCTITVTFTPSAANQRSAILQITDNSANSPQQVALSGTGQILQGVLQLTPSTLNFGNQQVATTSTAKDVTLTNGSGTYPLQISSIVVTGDFHQTNDCPASSTLAANASCTIHLTFAPQNSGVQSASLSVSATGNATQTVSLSGTGTTAGSSGSADFTLTSSPASITVASSGGSGSFNIFATPLNGFKQTINFSCSIPSGASCSVNPTSLVMDGTSVPSVAVTVSIAGGGGGITRGENRHGARPFYASIMAFGLIGALFAGNKRRLMYLVIGLLLVVMMVSISCGGGGGGGTSSNANKMTPGVYQVSITAATTGTSVVSHTTTVTLQVN